MFNVCLESVSIVKLVLRYCKSVAQITKMFGRNLFKYLKQHWINGVAGSVAYPILYHTFYWIVNDNDQKSHTNDIVLMF